MKKLVTKISIVALAIACCVIFTPFNHATAQTKKSKTMKKILFVVTSHATKGSTGQPTGYYLAEVSHAWDVLKNAGYEIDFVSPLGGKPPVDGYNLNDAVNKAFVDDMVYQNKINNSLTPAQVQVSDYAAIYYAGGHGTMWDFADNTELAKIAATIYEAGGAIAAVCHGPSGLVNIKLSNGKYLIDGKKINGFTNEEEIAVKLESIVPFMLETKLIERGAIFEKAGLWQEKVVVDGRLVTGQNPASAKKVGEVLLKLLEKKD
jgi:putative intracellular protease/amidase